jgi:hypothetical protein
MDYQIIEIDETGKTIAVGAGQLPDNEVDAAKTELRKIAAEFGTIRTINVLESCQLVAYVEKTPVQTAAPIPGWRYKR